MIFFSKGLGNFGRFGNSLWQLSFLSSMAKRYNTTYQIPKWQHSHLFANSLPEVDQLPPSNALIQEPNYKYNQDYFDQFRDDFQNKNIDVLGYFQNIKYFHGDIKELLRFKPELVAQIREKYKHLFSKPTIGVGIRRTDYLTSGNYYNLDARYYTLALQKFDYKNSNVIFITDDVHWAWFNFKCLPNAFFPKFESDIEQFIVGTMMSEGWVIANSTFHFWASFLSNCGKVIQPAYLFAGKLLEKEGPNHFYIENDKFQIFDHNK